MMRIRFTYLSYRNSTQATGLSYFLNAVLAMLSIPLALVPIVGIGGIYDGIVRGDIKEIWLGILILAAGIAAFLILFKIVIPFVRKLTDEVATDEQKEQEELLKRLNENINNRHRR